GPSCWCRGRPNIGTKPAMSTAGEVPFGVEAIELAHAAEFDAGEAGRGQFPAVSLTLRCDTNRIHRIINQVSLRCCPRSCPRVGATKRPPRKAAVLRADAKLVRAPCPCRCRPP